MGGGMAGAVSSARGLVGNQGGIRSAAMLGSMYRADALAYTASMVGLIVDGRASRYPRNREGATLALAGAVDGDRGRHPRHGHRAADTLTVPEPLSYRTG